MLARCAVLPACRAARNADVALPLLPQLEGGVKAIQIREVEVANSVTACFFLLHDDGSDEDVSYRKCLAGLFKDLKVRGRSV